MSTFLHKFFQNKTYRAHYYSKIIEWVKVAIKVIVYMLITFVLLFISYLAVNSYFKNGGFWGNFLIAVKVLKDSYSQLVEYFKMISDELTLISNTINDANYLAYFLIVLFMFIVASLIYYYLIRVEIVLLDWVHAFHQTDIYKFYCANYIEINGVIIILSFVTFALVFSKSLADAELYPAVDENGNMDYGDSSFSAYLRLVRKGLFITCSFLFVIKLIMIAIQYFGK